MRYEAAIRERAEHLGFEVEREGDGVRVTDKSDPARPRTCWHRLGGPAEASHDRRQLDAVLQEPGRWVALGDKGSTWVPWRGGEIRDLRGSTQRLPIDHVSEPRAASTAGAQTSKE